MLIDLHVHDCITKLHDSVHIYTLTCFLLVANIFLDSLSTGLEPKKSEADVAFCSLVFTGLEKIVTQSSISLFSKSLFN